MTPKLAAVLPYHLALRLWTAVQHAYPHERMRALDAEIAQNKQSHPSYFKEES